MVSTSLAQMPGEQLRGERPEGGDLGTRNSELDTPELTEFAVKINGAEDTSLGGDQKKIQAVITKFDWIRKELLEKFNTGAITEDEIKKLNRIEIFCEQCELLSYSHAVDPQQMAETILELGGIFDEL